MPQNITVSVKSMVEAARTQITEYSAADMIAKSGTDIQGQVTALAGRAAGWIVTLLTSVWSGGMALVNLLSLLPLDSEL